MKISVITPSFNQGIFIEDAIQSVLAQGYVNFEHIIIDACSTDDTVKRLKKYPHLKWVSEPDEGQSDALNKGFRMASGDIICWLNSDDFYLPGAFLKVINVLKDPGYHGVYSNLKFCNKEGQFLSQFKSHYPVRWLSVYHHYIYSETFFFKREILDNNILIDKNFHLTMDKEFIAHVLSKGYKLKYVNDFFSTFRWHGNNKTSASSEVKKITDEENIMIFNRYSGLFTLDPLKRKNQIFYNGIAQGLKSIRLILKIISV